MVTITAESSVACVIPVAGRLEFATVGRYGEIGVAVDDSQYFRDYCYMCGEPIRVPRQMLGLPNACSICQPDYRGKPGVIESERNFWLEQYELAEVMSG